MNMVSEFGGRSQKARLRLLLWGTIGALLLLPLVAMQFTAEVAWTASDFAAAAILLIGAGLLFEIALRVFRDPRHRLLAGSIVLAGVALLWAEGAVGVF